VGYLIPLIYLTWSMRYGPVAGTNPWGAKGLEWQTASPPPTDNFEETPVVTEEAYCYATVERAVARAEADRRVGPTEEAPSV
jgi:cytochrome c oxidase subunit 1